MRFFLTHYPCRIITTSVKDDHLRVLWAEIARFIMSCKMPLDSRKGGPLTINHRDIRRKGCAISYMRGMVSEKGEGMAGHHAAHTLAVIDEASGVDDLVYTQMGTWARKFLIFGNCNPCNPTHFFRKACDNGDIPYETNRQRYHRKVIRVVAEDSPNVKLALMQRAAGQEPTGQNLVPGVLTWDDYCKRLKLWDEVRKTIGLWAKFYLGAELLLFPPDWLDRCHKLHRERKPFTKPSKVWLGIDPAEGGDKTSWALIDEQGLFELVSRKTPNTTEIVNTTVGIMRNWNIDPSNVCMDRGGGGKQHADRLRELGYPIRTIAFGEAMTIPPQKLRMTRPYDERVEAVEERYIYVNRRSQMYGELSIAMDPSESGAALGLKDFTGFAIPPTGELYEELRRQLAPIPKTWDRGGEGRLKLLPKNNTEDPDDARTLVKLIGHSPDEADAVVLALHARLHKAKNLVAGGWS